ncbi:MAG: tyrosine-type recombinase/integrase [Aureispira sp.]
MKQLDEFVLLLTVNGYADSTIKNYYSVLTLFFSQLNVTVEQVDTNDVQMYICNRINMDRISFSSQKQIIGAVKLFYKKMYDRCLSIDTSFLCKGKQRLPLVFSKEEVLELLSKIDNLKYKTIIACIYSAGLRVSEIVKLKVKDIDVKQMLITIEGTKGYRDRKVMLSEELLQLLKKYYKAYQPQEYLFEGHGKKPYSSSNIQKIFRKALQETTINKKASVYTLRHSFATHLIENGIDIKHVQYLLGHNTIKTTQVYTYLATNYEFTIKSPLDSL